MLPVEYFIHENGGRPYKVNIQDLEIKVYKMDNNNYELYPNLVFHKMCESIWVGKSPLIPMTEFSGGHGQEFDGNTILVKPNDSDSYVFIGSLIQSFIPLYPIVNFVSPVGNNDVPYPFAIDSQGNHYLLIEDVIVKNSINIEDPYEDFYGRSNLSDPSNPFIFHSKALKGLAMGDDIFTLKYAPFPEKDYDRLVASFGQPYLLFDDDTTEQLSKEIYCEIMEVFETQENFQPLVMTNTE